MAKNPPTVQETGVSSLGQEDPLEKGIATHSSDFAWEIPWTEEPVGLQSVGSQRVGHNLGTKLEKEMATHSSTFAWKIPWTEESGKLQTMGTRLSDFSCFPLGTKQQRLPTWALQCPTGASCNTAKYVYVYSYLDFKLEWFAHTFPSWVVLNGVCPSKSLVASLPHSCVSPSPSSWLSRPWGWYLYF